MWAASTAAPPGRRGARRRCGRCLFNRSRRAAMDDPARRTGRPRSARAGVHRALPVPAGEQRVAGVGVPACSTCPAGAPAATSEPPPDPGAHGPRAAAGERRDRPRLRPQRGHRAASARASSWSASSRSRAAVRASAAATPGPRSRSRSARARRARTRVKAGSSFIGSSHQAQALGARTTRGTARGSTPRRGRRKRPRARRHTGQGTGPGAAGRGRAAPARPGRRGCARASTSRRAVPVGGRVERGVAGVRARRPPGRRRRAVTSTVSTSTGSRPRPRSRGRGLRGDVGRAGLQAVVDDDGAGAHAGAGASNASAAASASESAPPLHATSTRSPGRSRTARLDGVAELSRKEGVRASAARSAR